MSKPRGFEDKVNLIWQIADTLRFVFKEHEYGQVMLPFIVLRRLECALEASKPAVLERYEKLQGRIENLEPVLGKVSGHSFYNTSNLNLSLILNDPNNVAANLGDYINAFSPSASLVLEEYRIKDRIRKLDEKGILYAFTAKFADLDLAEQTVSNEAMGYVFEELLRKFSEMSNESAGDHYTPREVIRLIVNLLFNEDSTALTGKKPVRTLYDPACGTGGMLTIAQEHLKEMNPEIVLEVFGQEWNGETWAIARSDLMIKGQDPSKITMGNSLTGEDQHSGSHFDYCISNPPYGVDWKLYQEEIKQEAEAGFEGRYGAGLPPVNDGAFLFVQHLISKMKPVSETNKGGEGGSRIAVVLPGSPLQSGNARSGTASIRKWILENDWLEAVVAMPDQMFYNTKIGTYVWILTNRKSTHREGKIALIDARQSARRMRRSLGEKRNELSQDDVAEISNLYVESALGATDPRVKVKSLDELGFARITIERPLRLCFKLGLVEGFSLHKLASHEQEKHQSVWTSRDSFRNFLEGVGLETREIKELIKEAKFVSPAGDPVASAKGQPEADAALRLEENVPLPTGFNGLSESEKARTLVQIAEAFLAADSETYPSDSWVDHSKTKVSYEVQFHREFFSPPRKPSMEKVQGDLMKLEQEIFDLLGGLKI